MNGRPDPLAPPEVTLQFQSVAAQHAFIAFCQSGACWRLFWDWMGRHGYHV